jgi:Host cell surface-exposed lipoprotein
MEQSNNEKVVKKTTKWYKRKLFIIPISLIILVMVFGSGSKKTVENPSIQGAKTEITTQVNDIIKEKEEDKNIPIEHRSALKKANSYANTMFMSKKGVFNQLTSDYGEKFSIEAANYAVDNVKADWNANALSKAKTYQKQMNMSPASIRNQLISDYGEKFTESEADYAMEKLDK